MTKPDKKRNAKAVVIEWNLTLIFQAAQNRFTVTVKPAKSWSRRTAAFIPPASEQRLEDLFPLGFESTGRDRFAGPAIPIAGVTEIAFDTMQIGMDPGGFGAWLILNEFVRLRPTHPWPSTTVRPAAHQDWAPARRRTGWL